MGSTFGHNDLLKFLNDLPAKLNKEVYQDALVDVAKVVQREIKSNADSKTVADSVKIVKSKDDYKKVSVVVKDHKAKWFEFGTVDRYAKYGKKIRINGVMHKYRKLSQKQGYRGKMTADHFVQKSYDYIKNDYNKLVADALQKRLDKYLK